MKEEMVEQLSRAYYETRAWERTYWFGVSAQKCPLDLWAYQEILYEKHPDIIIECGTGLGGSALFLAHVLDNLKKGTILTIDAKDTRRPAHRRIVYLRGDDTSSDLLETLYKLIQKDKKVMVILDSDHSHEHVLKQLKVYSPLVSRGQYLILEDTCLGGWLPSLDGGPRAALDDFLSDHPDFWIDGSREKHLLTFNPRGYLLKQ